MKKPQPIHSILNKTFKALEIDRPLKAYAIWGAWEEIVGGPIALQTRPHSIRNRILFMDVSHSTWIQQLQFMKSTLLEKMNAFIGEPYLQDIRFKLGKITPAGSPSPNTPSFHEEPLEEDTLKRVEDLLQKIDDREVRKSLRNFFIKGATLERRRKKFPSP
jgi:hypothetical protein